MCGLPRKFLIRVNKDQRIITEHRPILFGASGAGNALTKATWLLAVIFFSTSIFLAYASARRVSGSIFDRPFSSGPVSVMPATKQMPKNVVPAAPAPANQNPAGAATPGSTKK